MFFVLDGSGFLFRAYYSLPKILDKNWNEAGAIFGFFRMLLKLLHQKPDNFIVVFDPGTKTVREKEFKEYKQNRPEIDEGFKQQIPKIIDILKRSGFDVEIIPDYEADDVISSLVNTIKDKDKVVVVSSDKDLKQLIQPNVEFLEPKKMEYVDENKFKEEYWFEPEGMLLYLSLLGDNSDNIPGVKGIGKVTASSIVSKYPTYDALIQNLDKLSPKIRQSIQNSKDLIEKNISLVKLRNPGNFDFEKIKESSSIKKINFDKLKDILVNEYGFKSFDSLIDKAKKEILTPTQLGLF